MRTTRHQWLRQNGIVLAILFSVGLLSHPTSLSSAAKENVSPYVNFSRNFESNEGQTDQTVKYLSRGPGYAFFFTPEEIVMKLHSKFDKKTKVRTQCSVLKMRFVGASATPILEGLDLKPSKSHYFIGNHAKKWFKNVANYGKVIYKDLYPGVDAIFYGNQQQLEYDITVSPGYNPQEVRLHIEGAKKLFIDSSENLHLVINDDQEVQMLKPFVYQMEGDKKIQIEARLVVSKDNEISFDIGDYDTSKTLVIDPVISYSTYLGGNGEDYAEGIAVDLEGNTYVSGLTTSADFPTTTGSFQPTVEPGIHAFISKMNATGSDLVYSTYLGGSNVDFSTSIAIDLKGNAYVAGLTSSNDFPVTQGAYQTSLVGRQNAFITMINSTGSDLLYSTYLGGSSVDQATGIAVDIEGSAYVVGMTSSDDFPITKCAFQFRKSPKALGNAFVTKMSPDGSSLEYSTYLGGSNYDVGNAIAVDNNGNAYITGFTESPDFPTTSEAFQKTLACGASSNAFISKLDPDGFGLIYSTYLGGSSSDMGSDIAIDLSGNAYVTGSTDSLDFPITAGSFQTTLTGLQNAFITKLNPMGTAPVYSTYVGGTAYDYGSGIAVDSAGNASIVGVTISTDFPTTADAYQPALIGYQNALLTQINSEGSSLIYSTYLGANFDMGTCIALDIGGNAYIAGFTSSEDFPITPQAFQTQLKGMSNAFVASFLIGIPPVITISPDTGLESGGTAVLVAGANFKHAKAVHFGYQEASFKVNSDNQITAWSPSGHGVVGVTVSWPEDMFKMAPATTATDNRFTYIKLNTTTDLKPSADKAKVGQPITLTAFVAPLPVKGKARISGGETSGTVEFFEEGTSLGKVTITNGEAKLKMVPSKPGNKSITAVFQGDMDYNSSKATIMLLIQPAGPILPPTALSGSQKANKFATQKDLVNVITWKKPTGGLPPVTYRIYRDQALTQLAGQVSGFGELKFLDNNRHKGTAYSYYIVSVDEFGNISPAAFVTVLGK